MHLGRDSMGNDQNSISVTIQGYKPAFLSLRPSNLLSRIFSRPFNNLTQQEERPKSIVQMNSCFACLEFETFRFV